MVDVPFRQTVDICSSHEKKNYFGKNNVKYSVFLAKITMKISNFEPLLKIFFLRLEHEKKSGTSLSGPKKCSNHLERMCTSHFEKK